MYYLAKNPSTGLYFDGTAFLAAKQSEATRLPENITSEAFQLSWAAPVEIEVVESNPGQAANYDVAAAYEKHTDPYRAAKWFVVLQQRRGISKFVVLNSCGREQSPRVITVPAKNAEPAWMRYKGEKVALKLVNGALRMDRF